LNSLRCGCEEGSGGFPKGEMGKMEVGGMVGQGRCGEQCMLQGESVCEALAHHACLIIITCSPYNHSRDVLHLG
jgi:hypothetical protein